jgi:GDP-4-dehydro-6-deoxy-D-mannose reductase
MKRLLLIGSTGFVGKAFGALPQTEIAGDGIQLISSEEHIDLRDQSALLQWFTQRRPDYVVHLAARTFVPESFENPRQTYEVNFIGTLNVLEALRESGFTGRFLYLGSGDVYGLVPESDLPVAEDHPLRPRSPYGVSKVAAEALCYQWSCGRHFDVVIARPFNHIGPGQSELFVVSDLAKQVVEMMLRRRAGVIHVGDLDITRDFTDVRDVIRAYLLLLRYGANGEIYNVCSGSEVSIRRLLEIMLATSNVRAEIEPQTSRMRPSEQRRMRGCADKLRAVTGWAPKIPLEQTVDDTLAYWKERLNG